MSDEVRDAIASYIAGLQRLRTPEEAQGWGEDVKCVTELDPRLREVTGEQALFQAVIHAVTTQTGSIIDDPEGGFDFIEAVNRGITSQTILAAAQRAKQSIEQDDRITSASVSITIVGLSTATMRIDVVPRPDYTEPFSLVLTVNDGSVLSAEIASLL